MNNKFTFFLFSFLFLCSMNMRSEEKTISPTNLEKSDNLEENDYCKAEGSRTTGDRLFSKFLITGGTLDGEEQTFENDFQRNELTNIYHDRTDQVIEVSQGDEIQLAITHSTIWMYFYAYIDYNQDKVFDIENGEMLFTVEPSKWGELPSAMPTFKIPEDAPLGITRFRFKSEWNSTDPCGNASQMSENRGVMIDYSIKINPRKTVSIVTVGNAVNGKVTLNSSDGIINSGDEIPVGTEVTITATPNAGYKLHQILINDIVTDNNVFTVGVKDVMITAVFVPEKSNMLTFNTVSNGTISVMLVGDGDMETPVNSGDFIMNGSTIKAIFIPDEQYLFKSASINGTNITTDIVDDTYTFVMNETTVIGAEFKKDPQYLEYCIPIESQSSTDLSDTYVESITTTGCISDLDVSYSSRAFYTFLEEVVPVAEGTTFDLHLQAKSLGDYSETEVWQDLRYTVAAMFIDWDQDGEFSTEEGVRIAGKLSTEGLHAVGGNIDVLDITQKITVPMGVRGKVRVRVIYNNAWQGNPLTKACGPVGEGVVYDFDMDVKAAVCSVTIIQPSHGEGTFKVMNGETEVQSGQDVLAGTVLTVIPELVSNDYELRSVLINGQPVEGYAIVVKQDMEIALDIIKGRSISFTVEGHGILSITDNEGKDIENNEVVSLGTSVCVKAIPENGYHVVSVMIGDWDVTEECTSSDGLIMAVEKSLDIEVVFEVNTYSFTFTYNDQYGKVSVFDDGRELQSGDMVEHGKILSVSVNPTNDQYYLAELNLNGVDKKDELLPDDKRSFDITVEEALSLEVIFRVVQYKLTYSVEYGKIEITDENNIVYENNSNVPANTTLYITLTGNNNELKSLLINDGVEELDYMKEGYVDKDGDIYLTDMTVSGDVNIIAEFTKPVGLQIVNSSSIKIYVNDNGAVVVEGLESGSNIDIYDVTGRLVTSRIASNVKEDIYLSKFEAIYLIKITDETHSIVKKLVCK